MSDLANLSDEALKARAKALKEKLDAVWKEQIDRRHAKGEAVAARIKAGMPFRDEELVYAARARCPCGAGLAYPQDIGMHGAWDCSDILTGRAKAERGAHTTPLPFMFYEIKSEDQPSAQGATTRQAALVR